MRAATAANTATSVAAASQDALVIAGYADMFADQKYVWPRSVCMPDGFYCVGPDEFGMKDHFWVGQAAKATAMMKSARPQGCLRDGIMRDLKIVGRAAFGLQRLPGHILVWVKVDGWLAAPCCEALSPC